MSSFDLNTFGSVRSTSLIDAARFGAGIFHKESSLSGSTLAMRLVFEIYYWYAGLLKIVAASALF